MGRVFRTKRSYLIFSFLGPHPFSRCNPWKRRPHFSLSYETAIGCFLEPPSMVYFLVLLFFSQSRLRHWRRWITGTRSPLLVEHVPLLSPSARFWHNAVFCRAAFHEPSKQGPEDSLRRDRISRALEPRIGLRVFHTTTPLCCFRESATVSEAGF